MKQLMIDFGEWLIGNHFIYYASSSSGVNLYMSASYKDRKLYTMQELMIEFSKLD